MQAHLTNGSAMLMLDGIDEVPTLHKAGGVEWYPRQMLLDVLAVAAKRWTGVGNRVLVTSRPYGVDPNRQQRLGLLHAPIQGLDVELQKLLVRRWFVRLDENRERGLETANAMIAHLHGERALDELAANPLLLTAMCIIYGEGKRLPADKHELYDRIVDTVLHKRYPAVRERVSEVRGRLAAVALGMHTGEGLGQQRTTPEASASDHEIDLLLEKYHQEDGVRDQGLADIVHVRDDLLSNSGLLVSSRDRRASFYHLSFQEFMAAERLFLKLSLERLFVRQEGKQEGFTGLLIERGQASGWRNTLVFLFGCVVSRFNPHAGVELLQAVVSRKELPGRDISQKGQAGSGRQE